MHNTLFCLKVVKLALHFMHEARAKRARPLGVCQNSTFFSRHPRALIEIDRKLPSYITYLCKCYLSIPQGTNYFRSPVFHYFEKKPSYQIMHIKNMKMNMAPNMKLYSSDPHNFSEDKVEDYQS